MGVPAVLAALGKVCTSTFIFNFFFIPGLSLLCQQATTFTEEVIGDSEVAKTKNDLFRAILGATIH